MDLVRGIRSKSLRLKKLGKSEIATILIFLVAFLIRVRDLSRPFTEYFRYINAQYATYARNYIWYGYLKTKFGLVSTPCYVNTDKFTYYFHHPPMISILTSLFFKVFGVTESSVRLTGIFLSMLTLSLIYLLSKTIWDKKHAIISMLIFSLLPISAYYDRIIAPDYSVIPFVLATVYFYVRYQQTSKNRTLLLMALSLYVGTWFDWQAYLIVPGILLHSIITDKFSKSFIRISTLLISGALFGFISYIIFVYILGGFEEIVELYQGFLTRSGIKIYRRFDRPGARYEFTIVQFIILEIQRSLNLFTSVILIFALIWVLYFVLTRSKADKYLLPFWVHGIISIFLFRQGAWIHDFWLYQLVPAFVFSSSRGILVFFKVLSENKNYLASLPISILTVGVYIISMLWGLFLMVVLKILYNVNLDTLTSFMLVIVSLCVCTIFWIISSCGISGRCDIDEDSLRRSFPGLLFSILLVPYFKNTIYPKIPHYGITIIVSVFLLTILWYIAVTKHKVDTKFLKYFGILIVLVLFAYQSLYIVHVRDSWVYPVEYKRGLIIKNITTLNDKILAIPEAGVHSYSSTFYSERCVTLIWNLQDLIKNMNGSTDTGYTYLIGTEDLFKNEKYQMLKNYLVKNSPYLKVKVYKVYDLYIFNLSSYRG